jgi:lia operon protein LiaG
MKASPYCKGFLCLCVTVGLLFKTVGASAQEYKTTVDNPKEVKLTLQDFVGDLPIEGYGGKEIIIISTSERVNNTPDRAKGLKPVYAAGTDNTGIGLSVEKRGNEIIIQCLLPFTHEGGYKVRVPESLSLKVKSGCERRSAVTIENMKNEVEVNVCQGIKIRNSTGPLVLSNISGEIDVVFNEINKDKPISIASISGEVDVTLPAKTPVDLQMTTMNGTMYSDFDFAADDKDMKRVGGGKVSTRLNGGGLDLKLTTISGNIYLRKK